MEEDTTKKTSENEAYERKVKAHSELSLFYDSLISKTLYGITILLLVLLNGNYLNGNVIKFTYLCCVIITIFAYSLLISSIRISQVNAWDDVNNVAIEKITRKNKIITILNAIYSWLINILVILIGIGMFIYAYNKF